MSDETKVTETQIPEETSEETAGAAPSEAPAKTAAAPAEEPAAEPEAPAESMADFEDAINASFKPVHEGDILTGTVIGVSEDEIILDFGGYTDGVIRLQDASDDPSFTFRDIEVGQTLSATVIRKDNGQGRLQLSMKDAAAVLAWDRLKQLMEDKTNLKVKIGGIVKGGAVAYVEGIRGFIPASKLSLNYVEDLEDWLNKEIEVRVITADPEEKRLVLSARDILREKAEEERKAKISNLEIGLVTEGVVESLMPYGAFINLGNGLSGLVHISQISQQRIKHPGAVLKEGQTVKVKVIGIKDGKISLSMKALEDVAAVEIEEETFKLPKAEEATTSLASLFKNIKLN
ncbi:MAG TPA: S1 RNA-binding domain-containing protein [Candidatus Choladousia intestinavium]|uniref:S1 RNA-binding domain-containing protein n=1 Tax=Candidatus Choladousia intestinavium TaxID=2840727 RepID=A0A9D1ADQ6_9FIRM|nr:S1 RNA-binding domain-containing protein [Candidatus Choladousia intestinavium]